MPQIKKKKQYLVWRLGVVTYGAEGLHGGQEGLVLAGGILGFLFLACSCSPALARAKCLSIVILIAPLPPLTAASPLTVGHRRFLLVLCFDVSSGAAFAFRLLALVLLHFDCSGTQIWILFFFSSLFFLLFFSCLCRNRARPVQFFWASSARSLGISFLQAQGHRGALFHPSRHHE